MQENNLTQAFGKSIKDDVVDYASELIELGVDSVLEDGLWKDLPFVSTVKCVYNIGNSIKDKYNLRKTEKFICEINKAIVSNAKRDEYKKKFEGNQDFRKQELEYLLILIDRYMSFEKPRMLAKLYIAYLNASIDWEELMVYAEVLDRLFLVDFNLMVLQEREFSISSSDNYEKVLRLTSLGLIVEVTNSNPYEFRDYGSVSLTYNSIKKMQSGIKLYRRTPFGEKLIRILK